MPLCRYSKNSKIYTKTIFGLQSRFTLREKEKIFLIVLNKRKRKIIKFI